MSNALYCGIDVSSHQGKIDWEKVKKSGVVDFVMIRIGYRGYSNGALKEDSCFKANIEGAVKNGIMIGAYFFSTSLNEKEAIEEAQFCIERLKNYDVKLPVVYDLEGYTNAKYRSYGISKATRTANCKAFINTLEKAGYTSMLYGSQGHIRSKYDLDQLSKYSLWVAKYSGGYTQILEDEKYFPNIGAYNAKIAMWQYTSIGRVNGIKGNVDMDKMYIDVTSNTKKEEKPTIAVKMVDIKLPQLRNGSVGDEVEVLQILLNAKGYSGGNGKVLATDGKFGDNTEYAVREYQKDHVSKCGTADGIVGKNTWNSLLS